MAVVPTAAVTVGGGAMEAASGPCSTPGLKRCTSWHLLVRKWDDLVG